MYNTWGKYDKAEIVLKEAQRIFERLVHGRSDVSPEYFNSLGRTHVILGITYRNQGQIEKAEEAQRQAMEIFEKLAKEHPDIQEYAYSMARTYIEWATTADNAGQTGTALVRYDKAIEILEGLLSKGYGTARKALLVARIERAGTRAVRGDHARATAEVEAVAQQGELLGVHLYDIACVFSRASAAVDRDDKLPPSDRACLKTRYADRAMDFLWQAVDAGWRHLEVIKTDRDIAPLRAREDFRKLLAELEAKTKE